MKKWNSTRSRMALLAGFAGLSLMGIMGCGTGERANSQAAEQKEKGTNGQQQSIMKAGAEYDKEGNLKLPPNHREWMFVGAPVTPNDMNDGKAAFPEFHNVYIDPASFASYKKTGKFAEGTVILKELVSVGGKSMASGNGYFQGEFVSLEAMVKDTKRFEEEPGGWAFFRFGEAPDYNATGARMKTMDCNTCHAGANEDYVFTSTYPVLRAAKPKAE